MSEGGASDGYGLMARHRSGGEQSLGPRSIAESESLAFARVLALVGECREELRSFRSVAKTAKSYRERSMAVLSGATEAVTALEEVLNDPMGLDGRTERAVASLAGRVQNLIDHAETLVNVYGQQGGFGKLTRMFNQGVGSKYDAIASELQANAKQARLLLEGDVLGRSQFALGSSRGASRPGFPQTPRSEASLASRPGMAASRLNSLATTAGGSGGGSYIGGMVGGMVGATAGAMGAPRAPLGSGPSEMTMSRRGSLPRRGPVQGPPEEDEPRVTASGRVISVSEDELGGASSAGEHAAAQLAVSGPARHGRGAAGGGASRPVDAATSFTSAAPLALGMTRAQSSSNGGEALTPADSGSTFGGGAAACAERVHRGKTGQTVTAMLVVPPGEEEPRGSLGHVWFYISRTLGSGSMHVVHLSSQVHSEVRVDGANTSRAPVCDTFRPFHSSVTALTCDERGYCWAASSRGNVRCLRLADVVRDGAQMGCRLQLVGTLRWSGNNAAAPEPAALSETNEEGMVDSELLREQAHYGAVTALAAAVGRVWTAGGSSAFVCLREWSQRGELLASNDLRSMGAVNSMAMCSPIVRVLLPADRGAGAGNVMSLAQRSGGALRDSSVLSALQQVWQLVTVHDSGMVQVWTMVGGLLKPILRIGERMSPARGLVVCESLGALVTSHLDGRLLVRPLPHPRTAGGLTISYVAGSVGQARMPFGEIEASKSGLAFIGGGGAGNGVLTTSVNGTINRWPEPVIRQAASARGLALTADSARRDSWPLLCYNASVLAYAMAEASAGFGLREGGSDDEALARSATKSLTASEAKRLTGGAARASPSSLFEGAGDAAPWLLDFRDLVLSRVIGEGAFGKVFLGRWQETDVAIKLLTSLEAFGIGASDTKGADGDLKLDPDVLRTLEREVSIMVAIRHPNIILFMGVCLNPACIVTEYCARGSLYDLLKVAAANPQAAARVLDWHRRLNIALDSAKGMLHLHSHRGPIIHRDLKSPNLLINKDWRAKVTDFNLSRLSDTTSVASSMVANNPRWHAPEVIHSQNYTKASDVYAFGLILWELLTWKLPFAELTPFQIILTVAERGERPHVPENPADYAGGDFYGSERYVALMRACWAQTPAERPGFDQVIVILREIVEGIKAHAGPGASAGAPRHEAGPSLGRVSILASEQSARREMAIEPKPSPAGPAAARRAVGRPQLARASQGVLAHVMGAADQTGRGAGRDPRLTRPPRRSRAPRAAPPMSPFDAPSAPIGVPAPTPRVSAPPMSPFDAPAVSRPSPRLAVVSPFDAPVGQAVSSASTIPAPSPFGSLMPTGALPEPSAASTSAAGARRPPPSPFDT
ncbi:hypothetical protein QBZ16_003864 [Prototheca wickerhamii]|uniref:Protein kinase domain-containing protein n=1 Tax=Prototheca wickerhamii TaxID=3111 RepID=A0AAD9IHX3_PROWI|nr:hypothetical protein QBZ16_003864 [Prototheca wickerhamii]